MAQTTAKGDLTVLYQTQSLLHRQGNAAAHRRWNGQQTVKLSTFARLRNAGADCGCEGFRWTV